MLPITMRTDTKYIKNAYKHIYREDIHTNKTAIMTDRGSVVTIGNRSITFLQERGCKQT